MSSKKILLIIPELSMGGAQRSLSKLSVELVKEHQIWLVVFNKSSNIAYPVGGEVLSLDVIPGPSIWSKANAFIQRVRNLKKIKKSLGIDISISFLEGADYVNILSKCSDKVVISIRGSKVHDENIVGKFFWLRNNLLIPWLYKKADCIVTVNKGIARELISNYKLSKNNIRTIGNFYDFEAITLLSDEKKTENEEKIYRFPVLITTGRLAPEKGLLPLIYVFNNLRQRVNDLKLVMVGDGPEYSRILEKCKELRLVVHNGFDFSELPDVIITGNQENVFKYLKGATVYLMNSSSEGFPNGLVEAMICNVPVVSSDCPYGPREILTLPSEGETLPYISSCGVLMPNISDDKDIETWVKIVQVLLNNSNSLSKELTENGNIRIQAFKKEVSIHQWMDVIGN